MHGDYNKTDEFAKSAGMIMRKESIAMADLEAIRLK